MGRITGFIEIYNSKSTRKSYQTGIIKFLEFIFNKKKENKHTTKEQLKEFESIFDKAKEIKIKEFSSQITKEEAKKELDAIQKEVDKMVYELYGLSKEEIRIVEGS